MTDNLLAAVNARDFFIGLCAAIVVNIFLARRTSSWNWGYLGLGLFAAQLVYIALGFGSRWQFGPHGLPRALVAPDGCRYQDGTPIDGINLSIIRSGKEEETYLAFLTVIVVLAAGLAGMLYRDYRLELHRLKLEIIAGLIRKAEDKRDWQEAEYLRDRYAETVATGRTTWPRVLRRPDLYGEVPDPPQDGAQTG